MSGVDNNSNRSQSENENSNDNANSTSTSNGTESSLASIQMATGLLQIYEPPLIKVRNHLKELIGKQNKIYIDLSTEKYKYDNAEIAGLQDMMNSVKVYREKLIKIKKQMQSIYQRSKVLKKRAHNIQTCKEKEFTRKLQKQHHEEALIGKRNQNTSTLTTTTSPASTSTSTSNIR